MAGFPMSNERYWAHFPCEHGLGGATSGSCRTDCSRGIAGNMTRLKPAASCVARSSNAYAADLADDIQVRRRVALSVPFMQLQAFAQSLLHRHGHMQDNRRVVWCRRRHSSWFPTSSCSCATE